MLPPCILKAMSAYPRFYQRVWKECAKIPKGSTLTYGELAGRLGKPKAARAVGRALGANPFAPAVPCHRVVAAAGLGGFSAPGGVWAKRRLLEREGASAACKPRGAGWRGASPAVPALDGATGKPA